MKPGDVGGAEAQFAGAFEEVDAAFMAALSLADEVGRAIRGPIVDDQHVEGFTALRRQRHHGVEHPGDVLLFVVGRDDDEAVGHGVRDSLAITGSSGAGSTLRGPTCANGRGAGPSW